MFAGPSGKPSARMMIFAALVIEDGRCIYKARGEPGMEAHYPTSAIEVASMLRKENAKALHVVDYDGIYSRTRLGESVLHEIASVANIPIQYCGGLRTYESVRTALSEDCVDRVVIGTMSVENPALIARLIRDFGPGRIVIALDVIGEALLVRGRTRVEHVTPMEHALAMQSAGVERIVYTDLVSKQNNSGPPLTALRELCRVTALRVTLNGCIRNYDDLRSVLEIQHEGVDSVILDDALYQNAFPCQKLWRIAEKKLILNHQPFY
jgi:phosphoribosylformimino-5-aminoimidazole carboxamide ribotide isomerase